MLDSLVVEERAALSTQCLAEFYVVVTARLPNPLSVSEAVTQTERLAAACVVFDSTRAAVLEACRGAARNSLSFWDALIWAVAKLNQVGVVLTEDGPDGRSVEGVRYVNPFLPTFTPERLGIASFRS